ncbi:zinc ribbon domain-containing protein [Methylomonas sp. LW13]|uniref:zinc ribbon domain-containing protein n=1 Tax=unclassified Methylomonas TaxID=2608980 RepID=UPI0009FCCDBA|nr:MULTISPECIES: zinc ribbon domain-containing protein [unclassified Methylomonas]PKD39326.1 zinc ribbon domain-containing protein [Methylomonas sp. Kb3]QBC25630.1 zinc ribbon domain-containing protein [Methylomonas sp. LW13]
MLMFSLISSSSNAWQRAAQLFITIASILTIGKLITLVPVMTELEVAGVFKAAAVVWFFARLAALILFYFFAGYVIEAIPNSGGALSFAKGIAEPLTALLILITVQALFWELLAPFVDSLGRTIYHSSAIILIVSVSIWFVFRAYSHATYLIDTVAKLVKMLSRLLPQQNPACQQCGADITANTHFCNACGHKTQSSNTCPACEAKVSVDQQYCQNCGSKLGSTIVSDS